MLVEISKTICMKYSLINSSIITLWLFTILSQVLWIYSWTSRVLYRNSNYVFVVAWECLLLVTYVSCILILAKNMIGLSLKNCRNVLYFSIIARWNRQYQRFVYSSGPYSNMTLKPLQSLLSVSLINFWCKVLP